MSSPWVAYAQTIVPQNGVVQNPTTHANGLIGEVSLPYVVPTGKVLHLTRIALEPLWSAAIIPWIGETMTLGSCLDTYTAGGLYTGTPNALQPTCSWAVDYWIPAGKKLNMRINAGYQPSENWIYGWEMAGELHDA